MKIPTLLLLATVGLGAAVVLDDDEKAAVERARTRSAVGYQGESTLVLPVGDLSQALAWYQDTLGLDPIMVVEEIGFAEVASPTSGLAIGLSRRPEAERGETALTFGVADMAKARKALAKNGVEFEGETQVYPGLVELSYFADPWGNVLMLHHSLAGEGEK